MFAQLAFFLFPSSSLLASFNSSVALISLHLQLENPSIVVALENSSSPASRSSPLRPPSPPSKSTTLPTTSLPSVAATSTGSSPSPASPPSRRSTRPGTTATRTPATTSSSALSRVASTLSTFSSSLFSSTFVIIVSVVGAVVVGFPILLAKEIVERMVAKGIVSPTTTKGKVFEVDGAKL
ncbi:hypothetical protein Fmac_025048 [Flemingia macrophylla]|uniref:Uncharacterized protein n=1 Tax=Flemingia macrophylla TaxID=520843 RepID=A0ABD1LR53_9FABA